MCAVLGADKGGIGGPGRVKAVSGDFLLGIVVRDGICFLGMGTLG